MAKGEGESSIAPFAGDTFAPRLTHWFKTRVRRNIH